MRPCPGVPIYMEQYIEILDKHTRVLEQQIQVLEQYVASRPGSVAEGPGCCKSWTWIRAQHIQQPIQVQQSTFCSRPSRSWSHRDCWSNRSELWSNVYESWSCPSRSWSHRDCWSNRSELWSNVSRSWSCPSRSWSRQCRRTTVTTGVGRWQLSAPSRGPSSCETVDDTASSANTARYVT